MKGKDPRGDSAAVGRTGEGEPSSTLHKTSVELSNGTHKPSPSFTHTSPAGDQPLSTSTKHHDPQVRPFLYRMRNPALSTRIFAPQVLLAR